MASSKKPASDLVACVASVLQGRIKPGQHLVLGLSGGLDSVVLLDILCVLRPSLDFRLGALHVNHQISPNASDWGAFCRDICLANQVAFDEVAVILRGKGESGLEAAARDARYLAFAGLQADFVVLAHHQDDQAETVLLQLLRGAGVKGLSGMPQLRIADRMQFLRPFLDVPRSEILAYAQWRGLRWVEDESNMDVSYGRNFLRHEIMPLLSRRFPAYRETLSRAAGHFAETGKLLDDLAQIDAAGALVKGSLRVAALKNLDDARARNLLRFYLASQGCAAPSAARLAEMLRQLCTAAPDAHLHIRWGQHEIRRFRGEIHVLELGIKPVGDLAWTWRGEAELVLTPLFVSLNFSRGSGTGISLARLAGAALDIRLRQGGERLQPDCVRPRRSIKNLLQEAGVAPWQRGRLPLLFCGEYLVCVPGLGVDCAFQAAPGEPGLVVNVQPLPR